MFVTDNNSMQFYAKIDFVYQKINTEYFGKNQIRCFDPVIWNSLSPVNKKYINFIWL